MPLDPADPADAVIIRAAVRHLLCGPDTNDEEIGQQSDAVVSMIREGFMTLTVRYDEALGALLLVSFDDGTTSRFPLNGLDL